MGLADLHHQKVESTKRSKTENVSYLAWADFKIKVKQTAHAFWNFIKNKNDKNSIMKSHKNYMIMVVFEVTEAKISTITIWNQFVPLIKMHYRLRYSLDFDLKIRSGQVWIWT